MTLNPKPWLLDDLIFNFEPKLLPINPKTKQAQGNVNFSCIRT